MRIKSITLQNIRLFGQEAQTLSFDENKPVTVILGNNGCGKSTMLDAASIMLSTFTGSFLEMQKRILMIGMYIYNIPMLLQTILSAKQIFLRRRSMKYRDIGKDLEKHPRQT